MLRIRSSLRPPRLCLQCSYSVASPEPAAPSALLIKVRNDMKAAMRAKDSSRLDVLRGLVSDATNSAKAAKPVTTDSQMISIIQKRIKCSEAAVEEFSAAKRNDLEDREAAQIAVMEEYINANQFLTEDEMTKAIQDVIDHLRAEAKNPNRGNIMKALVGPEGCLEGQLVDKKDVARLVQDML